MMARTFQIKINDTVVTIASSSLPSKGKILVFVHLDDFDRAVSLATSMFNPPEVKP